MFLLFNRSGTALPFALSTAARPNPTSITAGKSIIIRINNCLWICFISSLLLCMSFSPTEGPCWFVLLNFEFVKYSSANIAFIVRIYFLKVKYQQLFQGNFEMRKSPFPNKISRLMGVSSLSVKLSPVCYFTTNTTQIRLLPMPVFLPGLLAPDVGLLGHSGGFWVCAGPAWRLK